MTQLSRGDVWWGEAPAVGRRPFLVMSRQGVIPHLGTVLAAPITRTIRGIPSELELGPDDGMPIPCAATFDNLLPVEQAFLVERICQLPSHRMSEACAALRTAVAC